MLQKEEFQKYIGKKATYMNYTGLVEEIWNMSNYPMTLVKIRGGDSSYAVINFDIVKVEESGDSK